MKNVKPRILVYDFHPYGHCPGWMELATMAFIEAGCEVMMACCAGFDSVKNIIERVTAHGGEVLEIPPDVKVHASYAIDLARRMDARNVFFVNFDTVAYDFGKKCGHADFRDLNIAGIWLRPHLEGECLSGLNKILNKLSRTARAKAVRKKSRTIERNRYSLSMLMRDSKAADNLFLFLLNGEPSAPVMKYLPARDVAYICDPWLTKINVKRDEARTRLGLDTDRLLFLHAGTARPEKGLGDACSAFLKLPQPLQKSVCLLRAGTVDRRDAPFLSRLEDAGLAIVMDRYLTEEEFLLCFSATDAILMPYRDQRESSGILVHAAVHERPVIASDYGLIGAWTKDYHLGLTFAHKDIDGLACAIEAFCQTHRWRTDGMAEFAALNSPGHFQETLVREWVTPRVLGQAE